MPVLGEARADGGPVAEDPGRGDGDSWGSPRSRASWRRRQIHLVAADHPVGRRRAEPAVQPPGEIAPRRRRNLQMRAARADSSNPGFFRWASRSAVTKLTSMPESAMSATMSNPRTDVVSTRTMCTPLSSPARSCVRGSVRARGEGLNRVRRNRSGSAPVRWHIVGGIVGGAPAGRASAGRLLPDRRRIVKSAAGNGRSCRIVCRPLAVRARAARLISAFGERMRSAAPGGGKVQEFRGVRSALGAMDPVDFPRMFKKYGRNSRSHIREHEEKDETACDPLIFRPTDQATLLRSPMWASGLTESGWPAVRTTARSSSGTPATRPVPLCWPGCATAVWSTPAPGTLDGRCWPPRPPTRRWPCGGWARRAGRCCTPSWPGTPTTSTRWPGCPTASG